jgi:hypothetical protein
LELLSQESNKIAFHFLSLSSAISRRSISRFSPLALQAIKRGIYYSFAQKRRWHFPHWVYLHHY